MTGSHLALKTPEGEKHETQANVKIQIPEELPERLPREPQKQHQPTHEGRLPALAGRMACYHPLTGYRGVDGKVKFTPVDAYVDQHIKIPCGQCRGCRLERSRQWSVRLMHESQMHEHNSFVTLTYDQENLPSNGGLDVKHWQNFAKRLRQVAGPFRFYHCGEYGEENLRPHYHAILFGIDFHADRAPLPGGGPNQLYTSKLLDKTWGKGHCPIGSVTFQSCAYVARYCMKKISGKPALEHYSRVDTDTGEVHQVKPEYATMSRRPGIGKTWYDKYSRDVFPSDQVITSNGYAALPPKFYDTQLKLSDPSAFEELMLTRRRKAMPHKANQTYERLRVRETVAASKLALLSRKV